MFASVLKWLNFGFKLFEIILISDKRYLQIRIAFVAFGECYNCAETPVFRHKRLTISCPGSAISADRVFSWLSEAYPHQYFVSIKVINNVNFLLLNIFYYLGRNLLRLQFHQNFNQSLQHFFFTHL